jgi:methyl-accepting chemotaxis protein
MKLKFKLTLIVIAMTVAVILITAFISLTRSSATISDYAFRYTTTLAQFESAETARFFEVYSMKATTMAQIFGEFYTLPNELRRGLFDDNLQAIVDTNPSVLGMWTAWQPNALDGMDAELGPYITYFSQVGGRSERIPAGYPDWQRLLHTVTADAALLFLGNPVWQRVGGRDVPVVNLMYAVTDGQTNRQVAVVGIVFVADLQDLVDDISRNLFNGRGVVAIYTNDGTIVAHYDSSRVQANMRENAAERERLGGDLNNALNAIRNGQTLEITSYSAALRTDLFTIFNPIDIMDGATPWSIMIGVPLNVVTESVTALTIFIIVFAVIAILVSAVIAFVVATGVVKPVINMSNTLKDISEGEGDLTKVIPDSGKDEIADMARYFNQTISKIKDLVLIIKNQASALHDIGTELSTKMHETAAATNEITANVQSIKNKVINQSASVTETNATMEQITNNINKLNNHVEKQTTSVSQSSSAIEEMLANIKSVTNTLDKNTDNVRELMQSSEEGKTGLQGVAADIQEIARDSEGLLEINSVMQNIASQTNLLSMNAAIEAAHAGEAGKGFAVVADEIRKLAENSSQQSKTISTVLKAMKSSIDKITVSTGNVLHKFESIDSGVKTVAEQEDNILRAMEEQNEGSKQVLQAITNVNDVTQDVKTGSMEMFEGSKEGIREGKNLENMTQEVTNGMNEMATGAEQINIAVTRVDELSNKNKDSIDILIKEVSRFKVD